MCIFFPSLDISYFGNSQLKMEASSKGLRGGVTISGVAIVIIVDSRVVPDVDVRVPIHRTLRQQPDLSFRPSEHDQSMPSFFQRELNLISACGADG